MGFYATSPAPKKCDLTAENRVWGFFGEVEELHRENRPQSLQPRQGNPSSLTKITSGRLYWPSRDPIGERGGLNLYGFVNNNGINRWDFLGLSSPKPATAAILKTTTVTSKRKGRGICGNAKWIIKWKLSKGIFGGRTVGVGVIAQQVEIVGWWKTCGWRGDGPRRPRNEKYTEYWRVSNNGSIANQGQDTLENQMAPNGICTQGKMTFTVSARFILGGSQPANASTNSGTSAGILPAHTGHSWPAGLFNNTKSRSYVVEWNCCDGEAKKTKVR